MPDGNVQIDIVDDRRAHRAFCDLPYRLYGAETPWVAPLRADEDSRWSPRRNASLAGRWSARFVARRGRDVVGRIAVTVDPAFQARWQPRAGFFGFFECERDVEVSRALFAAAETALRGHDIDSVLGPIHLCTHDEVGLLVQGFDEPPTVLTSYNPPFYSDLVEDAGYAPRLDSHAYGCDPMRPHDPVIERIVRASRRAGAITVRASNPRQWDVENRILFDLYNHSFANVWGFVPLTWDEYRERAERFRSFYQPELVQIAEWDGRAVGFAIALPDINVALRTVGGRLWPFGWLRLLREARRIRSVRLILLGVLPEYAGRGIAARLAYEIAEASRRLGMRDSELSLVQAGNRRIQHVIDAFGGTVTKTFRLYEKSLGR